MTIENLLKQLPDSQEKNHISVLLNKIPDIETTPAFQFLFNPKLYAESSSYFSSTLRKIKTPTTFLSFAFSSNPFRTPFNQWVNVGKSKAAEQLLIYAIIDSNLLIQQQYDLINTLLDNDASSYTAAYEAYHSQQAAATKKAESSNIQTFAEIVLSKVHAINPPSKWLDQQLVELNKIVENHPNQFENYLNTLLQQLTGEAITVRVKTNFTNVLTRKSNFENLADSAIDQLHAVFEKHHLIPADVAAQHSIVKLFTLLDHTYASLHHRAFILGKLGYDNEDKNYSLQVFEASCQLIIKEINASNIEHSEQFYKDIMAFVNLLRDFKVLTDDLYLALEKINETINPLSISVETPLPTINLQQALELIQDCQNKDLLKFSQKFISIGETWYISYFDKEGNLKQDFTTRKKFKAELLACIKNELSKLITVEWPQDLSLSQAHDLFIKTLKAKYGIYKEHRQINLLLQEASLKEATTSALPTPTGDGNEQKVQSNTKVSLKKMKKTRPKTAYIQSSDGLMVQLEHAIINYDEDGLAADDELLTPKVDENSDSKSVSSVLSSRSTSSVITMKDDGIFYDTYIPALANRINIYSGILAANKLRWENVKKAIVLVPLAEGSCSEDPTLEVIELITQHFLTTWGATGLLREAISKIVAMEKLPALTLIDSGIMDYAKCFLEYGQAIDEALEKVGISDLQANTTLEQKKACLDEKIEEIRQLIQQNVALLGIDAYSPATTVDELLKQQVDCDSQVDAALAKLGIKLIASLQEKYEALQQQFTEITEQLNKAAEYLEKQDQTCGTTYGDIVRQMEMYRGFINTALQNLGYKAVAAEQTLTQVVEQLYDAKVSQFIDDYMLIAPQGEGRATDLRDLSTQLTASLIRLMPHLSVGAAVPLRGLQEMDFTISTPDLKLTLAKAKGQLGELKENLTDWKKDAEQEDKARKRLLEQLSRSGDENIVLISPPNPLTLAWAFSQQENLAKIKQERASLEQVIEERKNELASIQVTVKQFNAYNRFQEGEGIRDVELDSIDNFVSDIAFDELNQRYDLYYKHFHSYLTSLTDRANLGILPHEYMEQFVDPLTKIKAALDSGNSVSAPTVSAEQQQEAKLLYSIYRWESALSSKAASTENPEKALKKAFMEILDMRIRQSHQEQSNFFVKMFSFRVERKKKKEEGLQELKAAVQNELETDKKLKAIIAEKLQADPRLKIGWSGRTEQLLKAIFEPTNDKQSRLMVQQQFHDYAQHRRVKVK